MKNAVPLERTACGNAGAQMKNGPIEKQGKENKLVVRTHQMERGDMRLDKQTNRTPCNTTQHILRTLAFCFSAPPPPAQEYREDTEDF